jgi:ribonuclease Y
MSDGDNGDETPTDVEGTDPPDEEALREERRALEQRERGLSHLADELDDREAELEEREAELRQERKQLDERAADLDRRESRIEERESELDDRETAIAERERELDKRASELDEKEATLQEYVNDAVGETVREATAETLSGRDKGRFGRIGSLVLALVGVTLIVGGVLNGFAASIPAVPVVFGSETANLIVTVLLLFSGLAANLAAVAD